MKNYNSCLKNKSRDLRKDMTETEVRLWNRLRRKQINGLQFYRQKPLGPYIADFYCPAKDLVIEVDGGQHDEKNAKRYDKNRTEYLESLGLKVLRSWDNEVNNNLSGVIQEIVNHLKN